VENYKHALTKRGDKEKKNLRMDPRGGKKCLGDNKGLRERGNDRRLNYHFGKKGMYAGCFERKTKGIEGVVLLNRSG